MSTSIILLDLLPGNAMTDFATQREAWGALRSWVRDDGLEAIADLSSMSIQNGEPMVIAMDDELVRRVVRELGPDAVSSESRR